MSDDKIPRWAFGTRRIILTHAAQDRSDFADLRQDVLAVKSELKAHESKAAERETKADDRHKDNLERLDKIDTALQPLVDIAPTLKLVAKERRTVANVAWVVTKTALWFVGVFGLIATMVGAWPVLSWAWDGLWSTLVAHLAR